MALLLLTPLQQILNAYSDGLAERELRQQLAEAGFRATPPEIRGALHSRPDLFVSLTNRRWRLKSVLQEGRGQNVRLGAGSTRASPTRAMYNPMLFAKKRWGYNQECGEMFLWRTADDENGSLEP